MPVNVYTEAYFAYLPPVVDEVQQHISPAIVLFAKCFLGAKIRYSNESLLLPTVVAVARRLVISSQVLTQRSFFSKKKEKK